MRKRTVALLLLLSLGVAAYGSLAVHPYSSASPKRLALNHLYITEEDRGGHGGTTGGGSTGGTGGEAAVDARTLRDMAEAAMMFGGGSAGSAPTVPASAPTVDARTMRDMAEAAMMFGGGSSAPAPDPASSHAASAKLDTGVGAQAPAASSIPGSTSSLAATCLSGSPPCMHVTSSRFSFSSTDSVPTGFAFGRGNSISDDGNADSSDSVSGSEPRSRLEPMGRDFTSVFPVSKLLQGGVHVDAGKAPLLDSDVAPLPPPPGSSPPPAAAPAAVAQLPYICRTAEDEMLSPPSGGDEESPGGACGAEFAAAGACAAGAWDKAGAGWRRRVHLQAFTERAAWGILNVTTMGGRQLRAWSFGQTLMPSLIDAPGVSAPLITDACCPSGRC